MEIYVFEVVGVFVAHDVVEDLVSLRCFQRPRYLRQELLVIAGGEENKLEVSFEVCQHLQQIRTECYEQFKRFEAADVDCGRSV